MSRLTSKTVTSLLLVCACGLLPAPASGDETDDTGSVGLSSPAIKDFPMELLRNFGRLPRADNLPPLVFGATITLGATVLDDEVEELFTERGAGASADIGDVLGSPAVLAAASGVLLVAAHSGDNQHFRRFGFSLMQGFVVNLVLTESIKLAVDRHRPDGADLQSFPSGHTSGAFTVARIVHHHYGKGPAIVAYAAAGFVAASRLEKNKHWLSDVAAGATLGIIVGGTVSRGTERASRSRRVSWSPMLVPEGVGVMLRIRL